MWSEPRSQSRHVFFREAVEKEVSRDEVWGLLVRLEVKRIVECVVSRVVVCGPSFRTRLVSRSSIACWSRRRGGVSEFAQEVEAAAFEGTTEAEVLESAVAAGDGVEVWRSAQAKGGTNSSGVSRMASAAIRRCSGVQRSRCRSNAMKPAALVIVER